MMDPMEEEMQHKEERSVGEESIDVKEEPMKGILQDSPYKISSEEAGKGLEVSNCRN